MLCTCTGAGSTGAPRDGGMPLFEVPITVVKPTVLDAPTLSFQGPVSDEAELNPGGIHRRFYTPPAGCTWADVQVVDKREADAAAADSAAHLLV